MVMLSSKFFNMIAYAMDEVCSGGIRNHRPGHHGKAFVLAGYSREVLGKEIRRDADARSNTSRTVDAFWD